MNCNRETKSLHVLGCLAMIAFIFFVCGCASDVASRYYGTKKYPPKQVSQVELLRQSPTRPYEILADMQSRGETPEDMRQKAANIGADAVIVSTLGGYRARGEEWAGSDTYGDTYSRITGTAIKYKE